MYFIYSRKTRAKKEEKRKKTTIDPQKHPKKTESSTGRLKLNSRAQTDLNNSGTKTNKLR